MSDPAREWLEKADGDYRVAMHEFARTDDPVFDAVCYHCQQCVEKLMKAVLVQHAQTPPFTHDLFALHQLVEQITPAWTCDIDDLRFLSMAAAHYRYPGGSANRNDAQKAMDCCQRMREKLLSLM